MTRSLTIFFTFFWTATASADIYKWVDRSGNVHFSDQAPLDHPSEKRESTPSNQPPPESPAKAATPAPKQGSAQLGKRPTDGEKTPLPRNADVEMSTTSWCPYCAKARAFFRNAGILFTDHDIEKDKDAAARLKAMGMGKGVPVVVINGSTIKGFSPAEYEAALRKQ